MSKMLCSILAACVLGSVLLGSCSQSANSAATTVTTTTYSLNEEFTSLRPTPQYITVNAGRDTVIYGSDSTLLHFYANSFLNTSGGVISSGTISLALNEISKPGDYILNRMTTMTTALNSILSSGGAIILTATQNGQTVNANKYGVGFKQSGSTTAPMQLYYGDLNNSDTVTSWTQGNNTTPGTTTAATVQGVYYTANTTSYFYFDSCVAFNRVSCDFVFNNGAPLTNVTVNLPNADFNSTNTEIYLIIPAIRLIVPIEGYDATTNNYSISPAGIEVPTGLNYEVVVITNYSSWYFYEASGLTASGMSITAVPTIATWTGLINTIQAL